MYKLFINNKIVFLCQNPAFVENVMRDNFIIEPYKNKEDFNSTLKVIMSDQNNNNLVLYNSNVEKMFDEICSYFKVIEAAGGVVKNNEEEILLIHRRGFWDLPKGKIEKEETIKQAAVREVEEETGLKNVEIGSAILFEKLLNKATYHSYEMNGKLCMKVSYWFNMIADSKIELTPQTEEDIEQAIWVKLEDIPNYFDDMYSSIIDVLKEILSSQDPSPK